MKIIDESLHQSANSADNLENEKNEDVGNTLFGSIKKRKDTYSNKKAIVIIDENEDKEEK